MRRVIATILLLVTLSASGCATSSFNDMTADEHEAAARSLDAAADRPAQKSSDELRQRAREHRAAAAALRAAGSPAPDGSSGDP